jgi:hypothetical protein
MQFLRLVIILMVTGVLLSLVNSYVPMDGTIKSILNIVVVAAIIIWLLQICGLVGPIGGMRFGRKAR